MFIKSILIIVHDIDQYIFTILIPNDIDILLAVSIITMTYEQWNVDASMDVELSVEPIAMNYSWLFSWISPMFIV